MAEIEISILARQCLDRRMDDRAFLEREVNAWQAERNELRARVHWTFTIASARHKLRRLYPVLTT